MTTKQLIFLALVFSLTACSDPKYQPTINYESRGGFTVAETVNSMGNIPPYSFMIRKKSRVTQDMTFLISAITRTSNPDIVFNMNSARIEFNGQEFPAINKAKIELVGKVDPKNGRTIFDEVEVSFPYPSQLHWGEKVGFLKDLKERENSQTSSLEFKIIIPSTLNDKSKNIEFTYYRRDIAGENRSGRLLSF